MAAGLGFKTFTTGEVLTAADTNGYLMQGVLVFASAAARDAAITSPQEGQCCYLKDTDAVLTYSGAAWVGFDDSNAIQNSIVDAKGDLVAASGADTPARLAVGSNGETLVADSSTSTGLRYQGNFAAGKNKIINGDFGVWQRGTSFSATGSSTYTADRWTVNAFGGTTTVSRQTFTPGTAPVAGYEGSYFLRFASSATFADLIQKVEDVRTFAGQTVTVSFWAKAASSLTLTPTLSQEFGSGGSGAVDTAFTAASVTTSWTRFTATVAVPSISGKTIGTGSSLWLYFLSSTLNTNIDIWGVQLEAGSVATAFNTATGTIQGELAACQRYYYRFAGGVGAIWTAVTTSAALAFGTISHAIPMRTAPSFAVSGTLYLSTYGTTGANYSTASPTVDYSLSYANGGQLRLGGFTGMTTNLLVNFYYAASGYLEASAEL